MGDPASFVFRNNRHLKLYDNFTIDRGAHRVKFGAYYFHLQLRPEQPDDARGTFNYTGQFSGNAFADFLLGYPIPATSGIGRGDEDGRTNWLHLYAQDDWRMRDNLTLNVGLRYEYNQHMYDVNNRLSSIDLDAARFVIASDENDRIDASANALLPLIPIPYVTSNQAGWGKGLLDPSAVRLAREHRLCISEELEDRWRFGARVPMGGLQRVESSQFRSPESDLREPDFRPDLQCKAAARDAVRRQAHVLTESSFASFVYPLCSGFCTRWFAVFELNRVAASGVAAAAARWAPGYWRRRRCRPGSRR
jgi:hypothetical protein